MEKSNLNIKTSFVSPLTMKTFPKLGYLPIFIIRNIRTSELIGKFSDTTIHLKDLAPSDELFRKKRDSIITLEEFFKEYTIEISNINLQKIIKKLEYLVKLTDAKGIVLLSYGSNEKIDHRLILSDILNESNLLHREVKEFPISLITDYET